MSDLTATNCGGGCDRRRDNCGCNIIFLIILLSCCGGGDFFGGNDCDRGCGGIFGGNDNSCIWIILLLLFCGNGFGGGCGC